MNKNKKDFPNAYKWMSYRMWLKYYKNEIWTTWIKYRRAEFYQSLWWKQFFIYVDELKED